MILESILPIFVAYFMISEPIYLWMAYGKKSTKHQVKIEQKTENLMEKAQNHLKKFEEKKMSMDQAEEVEKKDLVEALTYVDRLKIFIEAEKKFEAQTIDYIRQVRLKTENIDFPQKQQLIDTLKNESTLAAEIKSTLKNANPIAKRLASAEKKERKELQHDLHHALVVEKESVFEHALTKDEKKLFQQENHQFANFEKEVKKEERIEKQISTYISQTIGLLAKLEQTNISAIKILQGKLNSASGVESADSQEMVLVKKKEHLLETIALNIHIINKKIAKYKA